MRSIFTVAAYFCLLRATVGSSEIIDQYNESQQTQAFVGWWGSGRTSLDEVLQTFTVGITGQLTRIEIFGDPWIITVNSPLVLSLQETNNGEPGGAEITQREKWTSSGPARWIAYELGPDIQVSAGQTLALKFNTGDEDGYRIYGTLGNIYDNGSSYYRSSYPRPNQQWTLIEPGFDISFRTYVVPAVPEPAAVMLALTGAFMYASLLRLRPGPIK